MCTLRDTKGRAIKPLTISYIQKREKDFQELHSQLQQGILRMQEIIHNLDEKIGRLEARTVKLAIEDAESGESNE